MKSTVAASQAAYMRCQELVSKLDFSVRSNLSTPTYMIAGPAGYGSQLLKEFGGEYPSTHPRN